MPHGLYCNIPWGCVKKDEISSQLTIFLKLIMNEDENGCTGLALKEMEEPVGDRLCGSWRAAGGLYSYNLKDVFTWRLLKTIAMGQVLSLLICGTAVSCQYLADAGVETPMFQSFLNYALLLLVYTSYLCTRKGDGNILQILKTKWWMYLLMGLTDVEANYAVVKAYQFTTLTSIQLLDCFVIPVLMVLSRFLLKTRYRPVHFVAVAVCLLGVGAMVGADLLAGRDQGSTSDVLLGDGLVLLSAVLYAVSNVCQEYTVKNLSRVEFLGMMGLFGTLISGMQLAILEPCAVKAIKWNLKIGMLFAVYALCMYALYSFMPVVVKMTSATAVNLSLLTADLFSLFCGLFLFRYTFSGLYIISFVVITVGFVMFNAVPTHSPANDSRDANCNDPAGEFAGQTAETSSDRLLPAEKGIDRTETPAAVAVL
ncbi:solute carrier family 35 member F2-like [Centroberyx gerrardi]